MGSGSSSTYRGKRAEPPETQNEILTLASEVRRVLGPGGWHVYTVRHTGDLRHGTGIDPALDDHALGYGLPGTAQRSPPPRR